MTTIERTSASFEEMKAPERLKWLHQEYGSRLMLSTSFGLQAAVMLDLVTKHAPEVPIVWIDTGYLFPETYEYVETLKKRFNLNLREYQPLLTPARQEALYGKLWEQGEEESKKYGVINKVEPMNRALQELGADVWISGLRKSQSSTRENRMFLEQQKKTLKVYPILDWRDAQVQQYYRDNDLPRHPLEAKGYKTMGDWHSTNPVAEGDSAESSRFGGNKYECGLHLNSDASDFQI